MDGQVLKKEIKKAAPVVKEAKKSLFAGFKKAEKKAAPVLPRRRSKADCTNDGILGYHIKSS